MFWPYAYYDLFDFAFWPYAYDVFWPYAYADIYSGFFGPYAYSGPYGPDYYYPARRYGGYRGPQERPSNVAQICTEQAPGVTDLPFERIAQAVQRDEAQGGALDELKNSISQAVEILRSGCPTELPGTPTGRLEATEKRLDVMLRAVQVVRPAMEKFYQSLNDEQKANFNLISSDNEQGTRRNASQDQRALGQVCGERAAGVGDLPIDRVERAVQPTPPQRAILDKLKDASAQAGDALKSNCPSNQTLTPPGRVEAMEKRLDAMLKAVHLVRPVLGEFYQSLNDEQKARFNLLGARGAS